MTRATTNNLFHLLMTVAHRWPVADRLAVARDDARDTDLALHGLRSARCDHGDKFDAARRDEPDGLVDLAVGSL